MTSNLFESPASTRSRLYRLKPIGIDTSYVESLSSFIIRLADAYDIAPKALILKEILPLMPCSSSSVSSDSYKYFLHSAKTLNGVNDTTRSYVNILEELTGRDNLQALTMLTWGNIVSKRKLLRNTQAWCSLCYEEWKKIDKRSVYYPLLWSLEATKVCLRHQVFLQERCPFKGCQKVLPVFASNIRLGYCLYCNGWLGSNNVIEDSDIETNKEGAECAFWITKALGELIEVASYMSSPLPKAELSLSIEAMLNSMPKQNITTFVHQSHIGSASSLSSWQKGLEAPYLQTLLNMCYFLKISPRSFFFERSPKSIFLISTNDDDGNNATLEGVWVARSAQELRLCLEKVLTNEEDSPPSIQVVAQRLGYRSTSTLYLRCSELAHAISLRYRDYRRPPGHQIMSTDKLRWELETVLASEEEPPLQEVALRLGYRNVSSLYDRCPDLARAIAARYRKSHSNQRDPMSSNELKQALEMVLAVGEEPFPTLQEVAHYLGYRGVTPIRSRFPDLARAIAAKGRKYNSNYREKTSKEAMQEALEMALASEDTPPPTLQEVAWQLGYSHSSAFYKRFPELCHKIVVKHRNYRSNYRERLSDEELRQAMETVLASNEEPPISLQEIVLRLGYCYEGALYRRFPELSHRIAERYRTYNPNYKEKKSMDERRKALEAIIASDEKPSPTFQEIAFRLGYCSVASLDKHFPQMMDALRLKIFDSEHLWQAIEEILETADPQITLQDIAKRLDCSVLRIRQCFPEISEVIRSRYIQSLGIQNVQKALEKELLSEVEPLSLRELAKTLDYPVQTLTRFYPELCSKIVIRWQIYRKLHKETRKQKIQSEVQSIVQRLQTEQKYPSTTQMQKLVNFNCVHPPIFYLELYVPWLNVMKQLGYEV